MSLYEGLEDDKDKGDSKSDLCKFVHIECILTPRDYAI